MIPGSYNNNMQLVQTKDHIMILTKWCTQPALLS